MVGIGSRFTYPVESYIEVEAFAVADALIRAR